MKFEPQNIITLGSGEGLQLGTHQAILDGLAKIASEAKNGRLRLSAFLGPWLDPAGAARHDRSQRARRGVPRRRHADGAAGQSRLFPQRADRRRDVGGAEGHPQDRRVRLAGVQLLPLGLDDARRARLRRMCAIARSSRADLGIPDSTFKVPAPAADNGSNDRPVPIGASALDDDPDPNEGGLVAFFAAQTSETTSEHDFAVPQAGRHGGADPVWHVHLLDLLARSPRTRTRPTGSWRRACSPTMRRRTCVRPTPLFQGKLDAPVFGNEDAAAAEQWPTVVGTDGSMTISAGQLHGLAAGTKLLVLPSPSSANDQAIGVMEVKAATQLALDHRAVERRQASGDRIAAVPKGAYVRLEQVSYPFELTVAKPDPATTDPAQVAAVSAALDAIAAKDTHAQLKLRVVEPRRAGRRQACGAVGLQVAQDRRHQRRAARRRSIRRRNSGCCPRPVKCRSIRRTRRRACRCRPPARRRTRLRQGARGQSRDDLPRHGPVAAQRREHVQAEGLSRCTFGLQQAGSDAIAPMDATTTPIIRAGRPAAYRSHQLDRASRSTSTCSTSTTITASR